MIHAATRAQLRKLAKAYLLMYRALLNRSTLYRVYAKRVARLSRDLGDMVTYAKQAAIFKLTCERKSA